MQIRIVSRLILQETLKTQNQHQVGSCAFSEATHLFQQVGWCKKQTSVSHGSTEAEVLSLDAGFRMDGIPAVDLWDLAIEAFHSLPNQTNKTKRCKRATEKLVGNSSITQAKAKSNHEHQSRSDQH